MNRLWFGAILVNLKQKREIRSHLRSSMTEWIQPPFQQTIPLDKLRAVVDAVKTDQGRVFLNNRLQIERTLPDLIEIAQGILSEILLEINVSVGMLVQHLNAIGVIAIEHFGFRLAKIGQAAEQLALDFLKLARGDLKLIGVAIVFKGKELHLFAEFHR